MDRPWFHLTIPELEQLVSQHRTQPAVLGQVWQELTYRDTDRSKQLMREVLGLLDGVVPQPPRAQKPDDPKYQGELL